MITTNDMLEMIHEGENTCVEFKKSTNEITKDVYETVCSFSNRDGGHIFLGVKDNGTILGIEADAVDKIMKEFVTTVNNTSKFYPALYITPEKVTLDGKIVIHIYVPAATQVCRCNGRIYDRNHDSDIDITYNSDAIYLAFARKQDTYYVNKVTGFGMSDLNPDLIERARVLSKIRNNNHPWLEMSDEAILRSTGLILKDSEKQREGVTIAGILLFGTDTTIMSVLPQHKTDAIFRVENVDRYDDRDVIITNLFDTFDRLMEFGRKHLSDPFVLEGIHSISARDKILREIFSNSLAHRDYSSGYVAKFVIEGTRMFTENANRSHGAGMLDVKNFEPFAKNPPISKVFREVSLADELGSGMRNTYKYTQMYSGGVPEFIEGDVFRTIIPLSEVSIGVVGPGTSKVQDTQQVTPQENQQVTLQDKILIFCTEPRTKKEIALQFGYKDTRHLTAKYITPLLENGKLQMTIPDKPNNRNQKYISSK